MVFEYYNDYRIFIYDNIEFIFVYGFVVIVVIISCINISNLFVMLGVGLLVKKVVDVGLNVMFYIKISLFFGSGVVIYYL